MTSPLDIELYKSLRAETSSYIEKVPGLWLQKLLLVGTVIAFLVSKPFVNVKGSEAVLGISAVAVLPMLAILLDAKMLEYALHARAISRFIAEHFVNDPVATFERAIWGEDGSSAVLRLARIRSAATWIATVIPTVFILIGAGIVVEHILQNGLRTILPTLLAAAAYLAGTAWGALLIYRLGPEARTGSPGTSAARS